MVTKTSLFRLLIVPGAIVLAIACGKKGAESTEPQVAAVGKPQASGRKMADRIRDLKVDVVAREVEKDGARVFQPLIEAKFLYYARSADGNGHFPLITLDLLAELNKNRANAVVRSENLHFEFAIECVMTAPELPPLPHPHPPLGECRTSTTTIRVFEKYPSDTPLETVIVKNRYHGWLSSKSYRLHENAPAIFLKSDNEHEAQTRILEIGGKKKRAVVRLVSRFPKPRLAPPDWKSWTLEGALGAEEMVTLYPRRRPSFPGDETDIPGAEFSVCKGSIQWSEEQKLLNVQLQCPEAHPLRDATFEEKPEVKHGGA